MAVIGPIGPSLGWLASKLPACPVAAYWDVLQQARADAAELVCSTTQRREKLLENKLVTSLPYLSMHLGSLQHLAALDTYNEPQEMAAYRSICKQYEVATVVVHPDTTPPRAYTILASNNIPVAVENLDREKTTGKDVEELQQLTANLTLPFVLDLQHAYEISKDKGGDGIDLASQLARMMARKSWVTHLHVSGEIEKRGKQLSKHAQLHRATNRREIIAALRAVLSELSPTTPLICEGEYLANVRNDKAPRDEAAQCELLAQAAKDIREERECILTELKV